MRSQGIVVFDADELAMITKNLLDFHHKAKYDFAGYILELNNGISIFGLSDDDLPRTLRAFEIGQVEKMRVVRKTRSA